MVIPCYSSSLIQIHGNYSIRIYFWNFEEDDMCLVNGQELVRKQDTASEKHVRRRGYSTLHSAAALANDHSSSNFAYQQMYRLSQQAAVYDSKNDKDFHWS